MSETGDEWGPWIKHDGSGPPAPIGTPVMVQFEGNPGKILVSTVGGGERVNGQRCLSWWWKPPTLRIVAYRLSREIEDTLEELRVIAAGADADRVLEVAR